MRRLVLLVPWALGLVLLLTRVPSAGDPIEALHQAERDARAKLADAYRQLGEAKLEARNIERSILQPPPFSPGPTFEELKIKKLEQEARQAESKAQQAAEARRAEEARNINTANATEARKRSEAVAKAKSLTQRIDIERSFLGLPIPGFVEQAVGEELEKFDAAEARKDFKMALERETELLDKEADRLEAEAEKFGASAETKAEAKRAREAANEAAALLGAEFPPPPHPHLFPPKKAKPTTETTPSGGAPPPGDFLPSPFQEVITQREVTDPPSFATGGPPGAGSLPVSTDVTVRVDNRLWTIVCLPEGAKIAGLNGQVIGKDSSGVLIVTSKTPEEVQKLAEASRVVLCFVEVNYCMIMTPLTAFRGHIHELHQGALHDHDAPDPPWSWSLTPPEPVVSWGGQ